MATKLDNDVNDLTENDNSPKYQVILFNDEKIFYGDVLRAVLQATKCSPEIAEKIVHDAHTTGKSNCYIGSKFACEQVISVLSTWKLTTELEKI